MKTFSCREVGMNCDWRATGQSDQEILAQAKEHAKKEHGLEQIPEDLLGRVRAAIHDVKAA